MNQIIHTGEFPKQLKIAKVKPLFKKGNQSSFTNYMPTSLLPSISKIIEHIFFFKYLPINGVGLLHFEKSFLLTTIWF